MLSNDLFALWSLRNLPDSEYVTAALLFLLLPVVGCAAVARRMDQSHEWRVILLWLCVGPP